MTVIDTRPPARKRLWCGLETRRRSRRAHIVGHGRGSALERTLLSRRALHANLIGLGHIVGRGPSSAAGMCSARWGRSAPRAGSTRPTARALERTVVFSTPSEEFLASTASATSFGWSCGCRMMDSDGPAAPAPACWRTAASPVRGADLALRQEERREGARVQSVLRRSGLAAAGGERRQSGRARCRASRRRPAPDKPPITLCRWSSRARPIRCPRRSRRGSLSPRPSPRADPMAVALYRGDRRSPAARPCAPAVPQALLPPPTARNPRTSSPTI